MLTIVVSSVAIVVCLGLGWSVYRRRQRESDPDVVRVRTLLMEASAHLVRQGDWPVTRDDKVAYRALRASHPVDYIEGFRLAVKSIRSQERSRALAQVGIKVGVRDSEYLIARVLRRSRNVEIAEDMLNSGSTDLASYAHSWASRHGFYIRSRSGNTSLLWGQQ